MNKIDNKDDNFNEIHSVINPDLKLVLNSINILCGRTGSGKSRFVFREISKLKYMNNPYNQFIYITDEENDKTYLKYKDLINIPIIKATYEEAYELITSIVEAKNAYEEVRNKKLEATPQEKKKLLEYLDVKDFKRPCLHSLVLFDDATSLFSDRRNPLNQLILRNRHNKISYFLNVHSFNRSSVPLYIKKNMTSLCYFGGFNAMDFNSFFPQFNSPISRQELFDVYKKLSSRDILYFDYSGEKPRIEILKLS
jgi:hypothetical protein